MTSGSVLVLGNDGYTGWPLTCRLLADGHDVVGIDTFESREYRGYSVVPLATPRERENAANDRFSGDLRTIRGDVTNYQFLRTQLEKVEPETVVNLAQIPSAPYSMRSIDRGWEVQENNIRGSLNLFWAINDLDIDTHVVQLATMGEYGAPDAPIPEGFLDDGRPAPKDPGSIYHASKVNTTVNTYFLSRVWDIPTTEVYQGIVYGIAPLHHRASEFATRFDVDPVWGTVVNRFTAQAAADHPLTVYGEGGQKRAMLSLEDCVECLELVVANPPEGDRYPYRAVNQFDSAYSVLEVARYVADWSGAEIEHIENPREEDDTDHRYDPERVVLDELGYERQMTLEGEIRRTYDVVEDHVDRIHADLTPQIEWA